MSATAEPLSAAAVRDGLGTRFVGATLLYYPHIGSTNDEARRLAEEGAAEGTVVVTDHQTAGRGRLGRSWRALPGSSLLLSLIFRPALAPRQVQRLTMACSLAVADAVEGETGLAVGLKWPNDVVLAGYKVGGILAEIVFSGQQLVYALVGIGLNVNLAADDLPGGLLVPAAGLSQVLGRPVARLPLLQALLRAVEVRYEALQAGCSPSAEWARRLVTLGQPVAVSGTGRVLAGMAEGVNEDGALLVRLADGRLETVLAGDVTLRQPAARPQRHGGDT